MKHKKIKLIYTDGTQKIGEIYKLIYLDDFIVLGDEIKLKTILNFYGIIKTVYENIEKILDEQWGDIKPCRMMTETLIFKDIKFNKIKNHLYLFLAREIIDISHL